MVSVPDARVEEVLVVSVGARGVFGEYVPERLCSPKLDQDR